MKDKLLAGWGWPGQAQKAHYFDAEDSVSLCRRWMYTGPRTGDGTEASIDDCVACRRLVDKRAAS